MSVRSFSLSCLLLQIFVLTVWYWEFYMLPLFLIILLIWNYVQLASERSGQEMVSANVKTTTSGLHHTH